VSAIVPLFILAPLVIVPLGYRLLEIASPGSRPPAVVVRLMPVGAGLLVISFWLLPAGAVAATFAMPWLAITVWTALAAGARLARDPERFRPGVRHATDAAVAFLTVGATFAVIDRLGIRPFGLSSTIILLTAVHFHFAGFVLPLAGALAYGRRPSRWLEAALCAVLIGIPVTALGFLGLPLANWVGAVLTASGGLVIGVATILIARTLLRRSAVALAVIAGASLLVSMPMAVVYATGTLLGTAWFDIGDMAAIHGALNALGFALAVMVAWTVERRALTRAEPDHRPARDPRRLGLGAAAIIAGCALWVAAISAGLVGDLVSDDLGPPVAIPRPILLGGLLMVPASIAAIGAIRRSRPILIAAGVLCLAQSFVSFAGVALPFLVPAFLLLVLGAQGGSAEAPRRAMVGGLLVIALGFAAWVAPFALTETTCWVARAGPDGTLIYAPIPVPDNATSGSGGGSNELDLDPSEVTTGCDGGAVTLRGAALAAVFGIGAVTVAALATTTAPLTPSAPLEEFA
jgi:hypothetical protein